MAPEESIKTVQMILTPSQGRPLPSVHLESVSPGLLLLPSNVRPVTCPALPCPGRAGALTIHMLAWLLIAVCIIDRCTAPSFWILLRPCSQSFRGLDNPENNANNINILMVCRRTSYEIRPVQAAT